MYQMGWGMGWGWVYLALAVAGVVVLVVVVIRLVTGGARGPTHDLTTTDGKRPRELLDERYARGDIGTAEYDERRSRLDRDAES